MFIELAAVGSVLFWGFIALWIIAEWASIHNERWGLCFIEFVVLVIAISAFTNAKLDWINWTNIINLLTFYLPIYIALGAGWSVAKWYFYLLRQKEEYEERREGFLKSYEAREPFRKQESFKEWLPSYHKYPPSVKNNKSRILSWMSLWWISFLDTFLTDFLYRIWEAIYFKLAKTLQKMSNYVFREFEELRD